LPIYPAYYRIIHARHNTNPLGYGNLSARWNSEDTGILYFANSISLAHTEWLSIKGPAVLASTWLLITVEIDTKPFSMMVEDLPSDWIQNPPSRATQKLGDIWAKELMSLALKVPSARLPLVAFPKEHNLLVNPHHNEFSKKVKLKKLTKLNFNVNKWAK
jgi:RES domain-containing protein